MSCPSPLFGLDVHGGVGSGKRLNGLVRSGKANATPDIPRLHVRKARSVPDSLSHPDNGVSSLKKTSNQPTGDRRFRWGKAEEQRWGEVRTVP